MNRDKQFTSKVFRDGVSQKNRLLPELDSNYISVEERDKKELLNFAQKFAQYLKFYDNLNQINGDWSSFFAGDVEEMVAYIDRPESFADDESKLNRLSQPHLVLFFTFLELLRYPQEQFKAFNQRYLDFYYRDVLKLKEKPEVADQVHTIIELASEEEAHLIEKGTLINAGQDSEGQDLNYAVDEDIVINQAQVASIKNIFIWKKYTSLKDIHQPNKSNRSFDKMLRAAVGSPNQGDRLPSFAGTEVDLDFLNDLYQQIKEQYIDDITEARKNYILQQLFFVTIDDFKYCLEIHYRQINNSNPDLELPTKTEWEKVYELVEKAYRKKINWQRRNILEQERLNPKYRDDNDAFKGMMRLALGSPNPGDPLPELPSRSDLPISIIAETEFTETELNADELDASVVSYIKEQLYMSVEDFQKIVNIKEKADSTDEEWQEVYRLLEKAQTKKRNFTYPPISKSKIENIYANVITEGQRFPTFANVTTINQSQDYSIGFAIASPILALQEGSRKVTLTLGCQRNTLNTDIFPENPEEQIMPFDIYLSGETEWIEVVDPVITVGDFILESEVKSYDLQLTLDSESLICTATQDTFAEEDRDRFLIFADGKIYSIVEQLSERQVQLELVGQTDSPPDRVKQYSASGVYPHSLRLQFDLDNKSAPVTALKSTAAGEIALDAPAIKILLKPEINGGIANYYEQLQSIRIDKAKVQVEIQDLQNLQLRNDDSILDSKSPFYPFGNYPKVGSSFYFSNAEIIHKKLDSLTLDLQWMGLPADFATHYHAYSATGVIANAIANDSFQASLQLLSNRRWVEIEHNKTIFNVEGNTLTADASLDYHNFNLTDYIVSDILEEIDTDDPFEQSSYFKLELENQDFVQDLYPIVLNKIALSTNNNIRSLTVYPPYTPQIKSISLNYTASVEIDLNNSPNSGKKPNPHQIWQIHPFGYEEIHTLPENSLDNQDKYYYLLPQYPEQGALYIGIRDLQPPQILSVLFQMVAGSGDIELAQPQIDWSYLSGAYWRDFEPKEILADSTNNLVDTGIIRFQIPAQATQEHQLLPSGLYWLRATVTENPTAIPDILAIKTQAVSATYVNQGNAAEHLSKPLPADSIQGLVTRDAAIETVQQPYTSFGGKPKEDNRAFTMRVSERLRHKQRALTPWDYEHLVLEHFPTIYKAKCITSAIASHNPGAAQVTVVVIPDISHTAPFFPLEPKVPFKLLKEIEEYLKKYTSPFVNLVVKNPRYQQIQYRLGISLRAGYEQGYYLKQLNEDLKRYLSPWAYEEQADITFGSSIYSSTIIHFIEKRPYVDYVANFKLIEQTDNSNNLNLASLPETYPNIAQVKSPDSILVSAPEHIIDLVTADSYDDEDFEGIGYMIINTDFVIR